MTVTRNRLAEADHLESKTIKIRHVAQAGDREFRVIQSNRPARTRLDLVEVEMKNFGKKRFVKTRVIKSIDCLDLTRAPDREDLPFLLRAFGARANRLAAEAWKTPTLDGVAQSGNRVGVVDSKFRAKHTINSTPLYIKRSPMTDYFTPTLVEQCIPLKDITPLERLLLEIVFDSDEDAQAQTLSLFNAMGPWETNDYSEADLIEKYEQSKDSPIQETASRFMADILQKTASGDEEDHEGLDFGDLGIPWTHILQDIVRRSKELTHLTAIAAFTSTKMRAGSVGGSAVLITADAIRGKNTGDIVYELMLEAGLEAKAPEQGVMW